MSSPESAVARVELELQGLHCAGCVATVEAGLRRVPGVVAASVNLATERATVSLAAGTAPPPAAALIAAVKNAGYGARLAPRDTGPRADADERTVGLRRERNRLILAALLGLPVLVGHLTGSAAMPAVLWIGQGLLTLAVFVIAAGPMMVGAWRALAARRANMDLLVSLGAWTALASSLVGAASGRHELILFDAAIMIVLFVALGKYLETRARGRASAALEALAARLPRTALRVIDGDTETVPIGDIRLGDRLRVAAHTVVPVDGEILVGRATLNEALLTGESLPVERGVGGTIFGGTEVTDGLVDMRATAVGSESAAARIARLVAEAQASKPPWQRFADRAASVFVPAVLLLALATFIGWKWAAGAETSWALQRMIAVLVVACPCALGLAIPTAVLVGTTRAAEHGILVRDAAALEAAGQVGEVLLDKTGTLTVGRPTLEQVRLLDGSDENSVLQAAAALEQFSAHPLAHAVLQAARQRGLTPPEPANLHSQPGRGVSGEVAGVRVVVGSADWLDENGIETADYQERADSLSAAGSSVVWVALNGRAVALLGFVDPPHPESAAALQALRMLGVRTRILSGDRHAAVSHLAGQLNVEAYEAQLSPQDKLARVRELVQQGRRVAMVGDGINDAPALAAADVGIALGTGADVAREAADICLVGHSPRLIAEAIRVSRGSARAMKQNLFWAVAYNLVMLPVAIFTPLPPAWATAAMMCSSLTVVANSLRLRRII
jgi:Cu+-exporting ATPase